MTTTSEFTPLPSLAPQQPAPRTRRAHLSVVPDQAPEIDQPTFDVEAIDTWQSRRGTDLRSHELEHIVLPLGRHHNRLHTSSTTDESDLTVVNMLGWTETIGGALIRKTHANLSHELPGMTIDTHATYGIDGTLPGFSPREIGHLSLDYVAEKTFEAFVPLYRERRVVMVAASMGAAVLARVEELNEAEGNPLDIVGVVLYEPCLVAPEHGGLPLLSRFTVHLLRNAVEELVVHNPPKDSVRLVYDTLRSLPSPKDMPAVARLGAGLLQGTPSELLRSLAERKPTLIQGSKDVLNVRELWDHPGVSLAEIKGKGHCMSGDARKRAAKIGKAIVAMNLAARV